MFYESVKKLNLDSAEKVREYHCSEIQPIFIFYFVLTYLQKPNKDSRWDFEINQYASNVGILNSPLNSLSSLMLKEVNFDLSNFIGMMKYFND